MVSGASSLGTPGLQQATPYGGSACRVLAGASTAKAQMATQVAQLLAELLAELAVAKMEGDPEQSIQARSVIVSAPFVAGPVERFVLYCLKHYYVCGNDKSNEFP